MKCDGNKIDLYLLCWDEYNIHNASTFSVTGTPGSIVAENRNKIVDGISLILNNAFTYPDDIANFLLLQLHVAIEATFRIEAEKQSDF